ncbi:unnamed protein product [Mytilus coruscus]|uniref:Uncharacterized protein n=1 Tax=Mytilus coruscus TaxID=42192 RepID=A0A6J8ET11_MYTCO|nr:unnamed protein product [Mytilus coruscus]
MNALLEIPSPKNTLQSLRNYYDKIETYVRGLESLGQTEDTYGSLLVPIILKKLPGDVRINLTRHHGSTSWQLSDLRQVIFHELNIMEEGNSADFTETHTATAAFHTNAKKFWEVEAAGIESTDNKSENGQFRDVYEANCISYHGNRYVAKLPWKKEHPTLLDNRSIAQRRTENVIKRLSLSTDEVETAKKDEVRMIADKIGLHQIINIDQFSSYQKLLRDLGLKRNLPLKAAYNLSRNGPKYHVYRSINWKQNIKISIDAVES